MNKSIDYEITKEANIETDEVVLKVKVKVKRFKGYDGYDVFPDDQIGNLLVAVGQDFKHNKAWDKIKRKFKDATKQVEL